jgi:hypothetical protein
MTRSSEFWAALDALPAGAQLHLDEVVGDGPAPGSPVWLAAIRELAHELAARQGFWTVTLPVGRGDLPRRLPDAPRAFAVVTEPERSTPPAVHRLAPTLVAHTWSGEHHVRRRVVEPRVSEVVSFSRQDDAAADEPGFWVEIVEEIRPSVG